MGWPVSSCNFVLPASPDATFARAFRTHSPMPRFARLHAPGALVHLISRFVNREFLLAGQPERDAYLARLATALGRCDWRLLAYALMSSHVHLVLLCGHAEPWRLLKPLHVSFAAWLNHAHGRFGPVFAERATTLLVAPEHAARLIAYVHNNPVRARLAQSPSDTLSTSRLAFWARRLRRPGWRWNWLWLFVV